MSGTTQPPTTIQTTLSLNNRTYPKSYEIYWSYTCDVWFPIYIAIIILYIYVVFILCTSKNRKLRSPYYQIFIATGIADIIDAIAIEYIRFSQRVGMGPNYGWLLQLTTAITGSNYTIHLLGNIFMSLFQFTAVWFPFFHGQFWTRKITFGIIFLISIIPIIVYSHLLFTEFIFIQDSIGRWRYLKRVDPIAKTRILDSILTVLQAVLCGSMSIITIIGIRSKTDVNFTKSIPEKSIILVEVINVIFGSMETLYGFISLLDIPITNPFLEFIYNEFVSYFFLMVCLNTITLPLLSSALRREISRRFWRNASSGAPITTVIDRSLNQNNTVVQ